jgi:hypothetical protein
VLPGVALLSEINPLSVKLFTHFDPLWQDTHWHHLLTPEDLDRFSHLDLGEAGNFRDLICVFYQRAEAAGKALVLRDYNYVDFVGIPYIPTAPRRRILYDALPQGVPSAAMAFIRHPVDQWLSLCKHEHVRAILSPAEFCDAYAAFLLDLGDTPVLKYEDFVTSPEAKAREMCDALRLEFDPSCVVRFHEFDYVTGDFTRHQEETMSLPARKPLAPSAVEEFTHSATFRQVLRLTAYADDLTFTTTGPAREPATSMAD